MRKAIIHVNQHIIKDNLKTGARNPVLTVKDADGNTYCHSVDILDKDGTVVARVVYRPDNPLSCGARVWIETYNTLIKDTSAGVVFESREETSAPACPAEA